MNIIQMQKLVHPGKELIQEIKVRNWTQKQFAFFAGKKVSEVNELIKGKRNVTIQRDIILTDVLGNPPKYWLNKQIDYDYNIAKEEFDNKKKKDNSELSVDKIGDNENIFRSF